MVKTNELQQIVYSILGRDVPVERCTEQETLYVCRLYIKRHKVHPSNITSLELALGAVL